MYAAQASVASTGTLSRDFKHLAVDMFLFEEEDQQFLKVECHFGKRKNLAAIRTVCSHVQVRLLACSLTQRLDNGCSTLYSSATIT